MTMTIRSAKQTDLDSLVEIEKKAFDPKRYPLSSKKDYQHFLKSPTVDVLVAETENKIAASAVVFYKKGSSAARMYSIGVDPIFQKKGLGSALFEKIQEVAIKKGLKRIISEIRSDLPDYVKWYESKGFKVKKRLPQYYPDLVSGLKMEKEV